METGTPNTGSAANAPQGIEVGKIEKELNRRWEEAAAQNGGVIRACVLNLIVYTTPQENQLEIDRILNEVTGHSPCRAIILVADRESKQAKLNADVAVWCEEGSAGARHVCGERIMIEAGGANLDAVSSAITPLLVSDIPIFLWWKDIPHYEDKLFNRLVSMADRVVIDSLTFDHPHEDLLRLAEIIREHPKFMLVSDVNWGRMTAWRTLIANFWDVPDYRPYLDKIDHVIVEYDSPKAEPTEIAAQALLIFGWLASRLGWKLQSNGQTANGAGAFSYISSDGRAMQVEMRATKIAKSDGRLVSLTLISEGGAAEFSVNYNADHNTLETSAKIGEARSVGRVLTYEAKSEGERLSRELSILARDSVYEAAINSAAQMVASLKK
jgi:glucose-6-phosphate dehydrogenase assembly protein OpcA